MPKSFLYCFLFIVGIFHSACNREKVNIEGRWKVTKIIVPAGKAALKDSISHLLPHFAVGNKLNFNGGELTVNRRGTAEDVFYGLGTYKVAQNGRSVLIDAGNYKPLKFKLRNVEDGQIELLYKRQDLKVLLREPEEE